jgi:dipeptidyl aminopeptidase/acylaminoacyl peptidase
VLPLAGGEATRASSHAPGIESFCWLPSGQGLLFTAWVWPEETTAAGQARRQAAQDRLHHPQHTQDPQGPSGYATSEAFYRFWDSNLPQGRALHLHHLNLKTGRVRDLFAGKPCELPRTNAGTEHYAVNAAGTHAAFVFDPAPEPRLGNRCALMELEIKTGAVRTLADHPDWDFTAPLYHPQGSSLVALAAHVGRGYGTHQALAQPVLIQGLNSAAGRQPCFVAPADEWALNAEAPLRWASGGNPGAVLYLAEQAGRRHLWRQELRHGEIGSRQRGQREQDAPRREVLWPGGWLQAVDVAVNAPGCPVVACIDTADHPPQLFATSLSHNAHAPRRLDRFNDAELARWPRGRVREVSFTGALGDTVQMWLTFPPGFQARRKHAVTHVIHGGPFAASGDSWSWRWNAHVLASEGAVVAQVNYHGSSGCGRAVRESICGRQGTLELQDLEAATDWLHQQPWVDTARITATGGSYGGFLVAYMNGHVAPGRYQAYVCHAGVFDRITTFSADSWPERPRDLGALYWQDMNKVLAQSPLAAASGMHTPTLVIHGARDYRVPDCNGLAYYNTLKARGVPARLLWFPDENHWVLKPQNSRQWTREVLGWLRRWAGEGSAAKARTLGRGGEPLVKGAS